MKTNVLRLAVCTAAGLGALSPVASAQPAQGGRWNVDWGAQHCTLSRSPTDEVPITFGVRTVPGTHQRQLILLSTQWQQTPFGNGERVTAMLGAGGSGFEPEVRAGRRSNSRFIVLERLGDDFLDRLEQAVELRLVRGETQLRVPLPGVRAAVAALRACEADALRQWGVDEAGLRNLRERPRSDGSWLRHLAYPSEALRANASGLVVVRLSIDARGRTSECLVVGSSGNPALDAATCRGSRRATFTPAVAADSRPAAARIIVPVRWWIQD